MEFKFDLCRYKFMNFLIFSLFHKRLLLESRSEGREFARFIIFGGEMCVPQYKG
jgi:hypothetical protein